MKTLDKYAPAKNLFDQIMATYETEEPNIFILNSRYLGDASGAPSGLKILAAHLDTLFTLMVENESSDLVRKQGAHYALVVGCWVFLCVCLWGGIIFVVVVVVVVCLFFVFWFCIFGFALLCFLGLLLLSFLLFFSFFIWGGGGVCI